jgi:antitoxin component of RelBE/YafQ-DinJ toxin-antitoxin module
MADEKDSGLISVRAQKSLIQEGKRVASKRGVSLSDLVRMLLIEEIERIKALEKLAKE